MEEWRPYIIVGCVGVYLMICIGVGLWAMRRTKSSQDFFMAGRQLGFIITGVAVFSSTMSGFGFVGGPGLVYRMGVSSFWMVLAITMGTCISAFLVGKRLRLIAELRNSVSIPDVVAVRYNSRTTTLLASVAIVFGVMGYLGAQILAMAVALQSLLSDLAGPIPLSVCVASSCAVLVFYCVTGGIIASVYTDLVQGVVMLIAAVLIFLAAVATVDGGLSEMSRTMYKHDPESISPWGTIGMLGCLSWMFLFVMGASGQPHIVTKFMMTRRISDIRHIFPMGIIGYSITALLWIGIGMAIRTLDLQGAHTPLASPDQAAPEFLVSTYVSPWLAGIVYAGLFAAIMSTADSFLNVGTAAVVHDIPRSVVGRSLPNELMWARIGTVVIAVAASVFAYYSRELVALLGTIGWGTFAAALVPAVVVGVNWKRATPLAATVAIATSLVLNIGAVVTDVDLPHGIQPGAVALLVSLTLFFGISLASRPPKLDPDIEKVMEM